MDNETFNELTTKPNRQPVTVADIKGQPSHLSFFDKLFAEDKSKQIPGGREYRVGNLEQGITRARAIISAYGLKLEAASTGNQAQYRAFDVKEVNA